VRTKPKVAIGAAAALLVLVALIMAGVALRHRWDAELPAWGSPATGTSRRIVVGAFRGAGEPAAALADSVAAQLERSPGIDAHRGSSLDANADYLLDGVVSATKGRTAIALRLWTGQRSPVWTATFWRQNLSDTALAGDLARAVIEALPPTR
jgi:hypothetical protein